MRALFLSFFALLAGNAAIAQTAQGQSEKDRPREKQGAVLLDGFRQITRPSPPGSRPAASGPRRRTPWAAR